MRDVRLFVIMQIFALVFIALAIVIMPLTDLAVMRGATEWFVISNGILFWSGILIWLVSMIAIPILKRKSIEYKKSPNKFKKFGLIHFFQNGMAIMFDLIFLITLIGFIVVLLFAPQMHQIQFLVLAICVFSFGMHCICNGAEYICLKECAKYKE